MIVINTTQQGEDWVQILPLHYEAGRYTEPLYIAVNGVEYSIPRGVEGLYVPPAVKGVLDNGFSLDGVVDPTDTDPGVPIVPTGNLDITESGVYDVKDKATATVDIDVPSGTLEITANGTYDVSDKASAEVSVPTGSKINQIATKTLTELTESDFNGITEISDYAFQVVFDNGMQNIEKVTLPEGIITIGIKSFFNLSKLDEIVLPSSLTSIGDNAFNTGASSVVFTIYATTPPTLSGSIPLGNVSQVSAINVPAEAVDAYKTAWSTYAAKIQAIAT